MENSSSSAPPSPPLRGSDMPIGRGYFSVPFERFVRDDVSDWASGFTLLDTLETYFDSRLDLLQRNWVKHSDRLKMKAEGTIQEVLKKDVFRIVPGSSDHLDREVQRFKLKVSRRLLATTRAWHSANVVRTREKVTFFLGVMSLFVTSLLFGMAPEWIHIAYTIQAAYYLPMRVYLYKKRHWHYFLFDLCYYTNLLNFVYIWLLPANSALFVACYCLSHGSVASAVITWRNSLVFHDFDKVTSLFVHIYPPLVFTVIRHYYVNAEERFPALLDLPHLDPIRSLLLSSIIYLIWQLLYWKFVFINRRTKIQSGQRATSLTYLLNDKRGVIGRTLVAVAPERREIWFMIGQLFYTILTELPAVFLLYDSSFWSGTFLIFIFAVSVWNGGGFYIEVFGRKFERELDALRKELAEVTARSERSSPTLEPQSDDDLATVSSSPDMSKVTSPVLSATDLPLEPLSRVSS
ncbi:hypothetical protein BKA93DRAFT_809699 [Sparassis latifolia]|uniref:Glycerophosphocholine acyltransferase 1 n=1 Tax=Sparassis crispa TaxID=139825 RepID=A0A401GB48_9APHY|nr:Uncharacterized membrane protein [Sparassis crispa]GBE79377.1 Uncharacterized membrane protein [Sparassis crispa]